MPTFTLFIVPLCPLGMHPSILLRIFRMIRSPLFYVDVALLKGIRMPLEPVFTVILVAGLLAGGLGAGILAIPVCRVLTGVRRKQRFAVSTPLPAMAGAGHGKGPPVYENPPWIYCRAKKTKKKEEKERRILTISFLK
ncbi:MAG: hypothetical protein KJ831_10715 [Candidatus Eisenbacteria bacterium]|nr:hypothetical protein [Planctomycetota bacterium]MBU1700607.1 hypothetical protein [Candidatus Eisenbacteria bacterium]